MHGIRSAGMALLFTLILALPCGPARADDPAGGGAASRERALEFALDALRTRVQARLKEAELLETLGRLEEALAAVRAVDALYREGMLEIVRLVTRVPTEPPAPVKKREAAQASVDEFVEEFVEEMTDLGPEQDAWTGLGGSVGGAFSRRFDNHSTGAGTGGRSPLPRVARDGLRWLAAHQSPDGSWSAAGFDSWCDGAPATGARPDGAGKSEYDVGVTGLALCAFLGAGFAHRGDHEFVRTIRRGLSYLKDAQDPEGCFGPRSTQRYIYNHALAALAMVEVYGMSASNIYKGSAQKGLDFLAHARNPSFGWRYGVKPGDNDTSCTMAAMMVLQSARLINANARLRGLRPPLVVEEAAFEGARAWVEKTTDPDSGRLGYVARGSGPCRPRELVDRFPGEKSESLTACGILLRIVTGEDPAKSSLIRKGADLLRKLPPTWNTDDGSIDMIYWSYGMLAMFQVGGEDWKVWNDARMTAVVARQRSDGTYCGFKGSWDPVDPWGSEGGRVYSTALMTLCCVVEARYERVFGAR